MRRYLWLAPLLAAAMLAGCSSARPPEQPPAQPAQEQHAAANQASPGAMQAKQAGPNRIQVTGVPAAAVRTGSVSIDLAKLKGLQAAVDAGHMPGNLDPESVVREMGQVLGLDPALDLVRLERRISQGEGSGTAEAYVYVLHAGREYIVQLIQPVKGGPAGIWAINSIRDIGSQQENDLKLAVLTQYFQALADKRYDAAYGLMSRRFRQGLAGPKELAGNSIQALQGIERVAWASPGPDTFYVDIKLKLSSDNRSAWGNGDNGRFASLVQEDDGWRIDGLATSP